MSRQRVIVPDRPQPTKPQKVAAWNRENGICWWCGKPVPQSGPAVEYDHRIKRGVSADDSADNLCPLHVACHRAKTDGPDAKLQSKVRGQEKMTKAKERKPGGFRGWRNMRGEIVWRDR
jgi:5-methylcytosine-specific restriction endonuclease McrA